MNKPLIYVAWTLLVGLAGLIVGWVTSLLLIGAQ